MVAQLRQRPGPLGEACGPGSAGPSLHQHTPRSWGGREAVTLRQRRAVDSLLSHPKPKVREGRSWRWGSPE